ncbi:MBL fold metallo-hydrolase [Candidatus Wolfebacteria bacterium]|nr:MBL fold metallo-hydrolase [Candidatus Wolfebacteria bacterium]
MVIQYHGLESFKVQFGDTTLAFNPVSKKSAHRSTSFGADIALVSLNHPDMNGVETAARGDKNPFVVSGPGEYEISGVAVRGLPSTSHYGGSNGINTIYLVTLEGMYLCFLGTLGEGELPSAIQEELDEIDILFIPVGGSGVLDAKAAHKLSTKLEPHIVVPMHYTDTSLKQFLREEGESNGTPVDKLTLKQKDLVGKEGEIIVLKTL